MTYEECIHGLPPFACQICLRGPSSRRLEPEVTECSWCGADVIWCIDPVTGRRNALEPDPDPAGYINMAMSFTEKMPEITYVPAGTGQYISHLGICPERR